MSKPQAAQAREGRGQEAGVGLHALASVGRRCTVAPAVSGTCHAPLPVLPPPSPPPPLPHPHAPLPPGVRRVHHVWVLPAPRGSPFPPGALRGHAARLEGGRGHTPGAALCNGERGAPGRGARGRSHTLCRAPRRVESFGQGRAHSGREETPVAHTQLPLWRPALPGRAPRAGHPKAWPPDPRAPPPCLPAPPPPPTPGRRRRGRCRRRRVFCGRRRGGAGGDDRPGALDLLRRQRAGGRRRPRGRGRRPGHGPSQKGGPAGVRGVV